MAGFVLPTTPLLDPLNIYSFPKVPTSPVILSTTEILTVDMRHWEITRLIVRVTQVREPIMKVCFSKKEKVGLNRHHNTGLPER